MKNYEMPEISSDLLYFRLYESATLFFGDIVGFTKLTAMSTASQTIKVIT